MSTMTDEATGWEAVIGLEVHVELNTKSKLFSRAKNHFGDPPNTNISAVCTGQPGTLPVLNQEAVYKAVQLGCAIAAQVAHFSTFDRKSYFYPDSPRNFQITQFYHPILKGGHIVAEVDGKEKSFAIHHAHLEDDAAMLKHFGSFTGIDYNRAGVPLIEVVSEPCMHSPKEAVAYAMALKAILQYIGASDCNMEEGSLRIDANVSVRRKGEPLRPKVEIKNMNSFSNLELALSFEIERQIDLYQSAPHQQPDRVVSRSSVRWDPDNKRTVVMRSKEKNEDYRYCSEPDLPPIFLDEAYIEKVRQMLPELPRQRCLRYVEQLGLSFESSFTLTSDKALADYFEEALKICGNARMLCNWMVVEFPGRLRNGSLVDSAIPPAHLAHLVAMIESQKITGKIAKSVADCMVERPGVDPCHIVAHNPDFQPINDQKAIEAVVKEVLEQNAKLVEEIKAAFAQDAGKEPKALGFLVGQVMKKTKGKAPPLVVNDLIKKSLEH